MRHTEPDYSTTGLPHGYGTLLVVACLAVGLVACLLFIAVCLDKFSLS